MGRCLIVSEDETIRTVLQSFLAHLGYTSEETGYGVVVLSMLEQEEVDFVITDPQTLFKRRREILEMPHSFVANPTICVNCNLSGAYFWWILNTDSVEFFTKPYTLRELALMVLQFMFRK